jgi:UrcA family protein
MYMEPKMNRRASLIATLLVAGAGFGIAQESAGREVVRAARVSFAGLDLGTASGQREFDRRVGAAIRRVCETPQGAGSQGSHRDLVKCRRKAREDVRLQLHTRGIAAGNLVTRN